MPSTLNSSLLHPFFLTVNCIRTESKNLVCHLKKRVPIPFGIGLYDYIYTYKREKMFFIIMVGFTWNFETSFAPHTLSYNFFRESFKTWKNSPRTFLISYCFFTLCCALYKIEFSIYLFETCFEKVVSLSIFFTEFIWYFSFEVGYF